MIDKNRRMVISIDPDLRSSVERHRRNDPRFDHNSAMVEHLIQLGLQVYKERGAQALDAQAGRFDG